MPSCGEGLWVGEEMNPVGLLALAASPEEIHSRGLRPAPPPPKGTHSEHQASSQFKGCSGISTSLCLGGVKTITSTSLETSLELELWSLFLPRGFNTVEKVRGEGGVSKPTTPRAAGVQQPLRTGSG